MMMNRVSSLLLSLAALTCAGPVLAVSVSSPDGGTMFTFSFNARTEPVYSVRRGDEVVIREARLGLRFNDQQPFDQDLRIIDTQRSSHDDTWEQPWGERRLVRDRHNELLIRLESADGASRRIDLRVRVFDDGLGFRYEVPKQAGYGEVGIVDEITEFHLPKGSEAWWIPGRRYNRYEYIYRHTPLSEVETAHTPFTLKTPGGTYLSLHEAALVDYSGYVLDQRRNDILETDLTPASDGPPVRTRTPFKTPWRTIQIAADAVGLINSDLILNLNEPNVLGDVSWVEPGKFVGIWWSLHRRLETWEAGPHHGATTENTMRYMDFAEKYGFDGVLVEGWNTGWDDWFHAGDRFSFTEAYPDFDLEAVTRYGREKGVQLIGHHETAGGVGRYAALMPAAYDLYQRVGVHQIKTGYVADGGDAKHVNAEGVAHYEWHESQYMVNEYQRSINEAAKRRISIITHEPIKDTGLRRTYPNWLAREGARGQEYNAWGDPPNPPGHVPTLAFTRLLSGPMDFTPGIFELQFELSGQPRIIPSTLARQLALYVVIYSPVQMAADLPENYEARPDAFQFIIDVPTDWERSIALYGEVGEFVAVARQQRGGSDWYLGAVTDEKARRLTLPLAFLDEATTYTAEIYRDGDQAHWKTAPYDYVVERRSVTAKDALELALAPGGGAAIRMYPSGE